jgi:hypothetical protein
MGFSDDCLCVDCFPPSKSPAGPWGTIFVGVEIVSLPLPGFFNWLPIGVFAPTS